MRIKKLSEIIEFNSNENFKVTNLVSSELEFLGGIKLFLDDYQMTEDSHKILFRARYSRVIFK